MVRTKKTRNSRKIETMISNMNINIVRYRASLQNPKPGYFVPKFLEEFRMLPSSLYSPLATEKFESFIKTWGTHLVTAVKLGGKFKMTRTVKNDGTVRIDDLQRETQNEFERVTGSGRQRYGITVPRTASQGYGITVPNTACEIVTANIPLFPIPWLFSQLIPEYSKTDTEYR